MGFPPVLANHRHNAFHGKDLNYRHGASEPNLSPPGGHAGALPLSGVQNIISHATRLRDDAPMAPRRRRESPPEIWKIDFREYII